jgi:simple sugar transport system substrate-binding protein
VGIARAPEEVDGMARVANEEKPLRFVFIAPCAGEEFFKPVKRGMYDASMLMGVESSFIGTKDVDLDQQITLVRRAIEEGYDGIALSIIHATAFDSVVQDALDKGIAMVAFNVDGSNRMGGRLTAVCQDTLAAGQTLGRTAEPSIKAGSTVLVTQHSEGISALDDRLRGTQEALSGKGITWIPLITGINAGEAAEKIASALQANPEIKTILGTGLADTEGAGLALESCSFLEGYFTAGFDISTEVLRLIKKGVIAFTIDQQPYVQGFYPVVQMSQYCRYGIKPSDIDSGGVIITEDDVDDILRLSEQDLR